MQDPMPRVETDFEYAKYFRAACHSLASGVLRFGRLPARYIHNFTLPEVVPVPDQVKDKSQGCC